MKNPFKSQALRRLLGAGLLGAIVLPLTSCGGGAGGSDSSIRPRTLDGLVLSLPNNERFEFVRSLSSPNAENNGDIESGTFFYTFGGRNIQQFPALNGETSDVGFPDSVTGATYSYQAVNESSGIITLTGTGVNDLSVTGGFNALNPSFTNFFTAGGPIGTPEPSNIVQIDITFSSAGGVIDVVDTTFSIPNTSTPTTDAVRIDPTLTVGLAGGQVPVGYNPEINLDRPSRIRPNTLDQTLIQFTDPTLTAADFTLQFVAQNSGFSVGATVDDPEIGSAIERVGGGATLPGVDYSYQLVEQSDSATLIVSGGGNDQDGTYRLDFTGPESGTVQQLSGSGVLLTGTFLVNP